MIVVSNKKDEICLIKLFRESVNMKKVLLFLFLVLCIFTSCKSSNVKSVVAAESKFDLDFLADNEISFSYRNKGYMPLLSLCVEQDSVDKVELKLEFDTGGSNILSRKGINKLSPSFKPDSTTTYNIKIPSLETKNGFSFTDRTFSFRKDEFQDGIAGLLTDGSIGLSFFNQYKVITIDFIKRKIILDGEILDAIPIEMKEVDVLGNLFYEIPIVINGKNDFAIIDTGTQGNGVLRLNYGNEKQIIDDEKYLVPVDKSILTNKTYINIEKLQVGNQVFENIKFIDSKTKKIKIPDLVRNVALYNNTLGIDFFKNKIIQFDMENKLFRMK